VSLLRFKNITSLHYNSMVEVLSKGDKSPPTGNSSQRQIEDYGVRLLAESAKRFFVPLRSTQNDSQRSTQNDSQRSTQNDSQRGL